MRTIYFMIILGLVCLTSYTSAQESMDSTGFEGDNFSLGGALALFEKAASPEAFEKMLNQEDNYVNNLDLNKDGQTDYVKITDITENGLHAIVLQVDINSEETQDIAVILIEKTGKENAILQILGNEDVYGEEVIVEPFAESLDSGGKGGAPSATGPFRMVVNVWGWPAVGFIYAPGYQPYHSPWRYSYYPGWWRPWKNHPWRMHHNRCLSYHVHFKPFHQHRLIKANNFYKPKRKSSVTVRTRTVHSRTIVKTNNTGNKKVVKSKKVSNTTITKSQKGNKTKTTKVKTEKKSKTTKTQKGKRNKTSKTKSTKKVKKRK